MALKHVILLVLHRGDATGYDITKEFDNMLGYFWRATHQQVYRELSSMVENELVEYRVEHQADKPDKKIYHLTELGFTELKDWLLAPFSPKVVKDELLIRLLGYEIIDSESMKRVVSEQKKIHQKKLDEYLEIEKRIRFETPVESMSPTFKIFCLPLRRGIHSERSWLAWVEEVESALDNL